MPFWYPSNAITYFRFLKHRPIYWSSHFMGTA